MKTTAPAARIKRASQGNGRASVVFIVKDNLSSIGSWLKRKCTFWSIVTINVRPQRLMRNL